MPDVLSAIGRLGHCDCDCTETKRVSHTMEFVKEWYGYLAFDVDAMTVIDRVFRKFTIDATLDAGASGVFVLHGEVEFNRLNGWPTISYTYTKDGAPAPLPDPPSPQYHDWAAFPFRTDTDYLPGGSEEIAWTSVSATQLVFTDATQSVTWTLSEPYTIEDLKADLDAMYGMFHEFGPDVDGLENATASVEYNSASPLYPCLTFPTDPPVVQECIPDFGLGDDAYFPINSQIIDLMPPSQDPELVITLSPGTTQVAFNILTVFGTLSTWSQGAWQYQKFLTVYPDGAPPLCVTRNLVSSLESIPDVCRVPAVVHISGVDYLLLPPPPPRAFDAMLAGNSWDYLDTLCEHCNLTDGTDCPCTSDDIIQQSEENNTGQMPFAHDPDDSEIAAASFRAVRSFILTKIEVLLGKFSTPTGTLSLALMSATGAPGIPNNVLASAAVTFDGDDIGIVPTWLEFPFSDFLLRSGRYYYIRITSADAFDHKYYLWAANTTYGNNRMYRRGADDSWIGNQWNLHVAGACVRLWGH